jgi:catechol 2,3-dioxygenase-like lactoylglutathione lyase family enzyme
MLLLNKVHHIAIICSDYQKSKAFYTEILGMTIIQEIYRKERQSYKLDLTLNGKFIPSSYFRFQIRHNIYQYPKQLNYAIWLLK